MRSVKSGILYKGFTSELNERIQWHNAGKSKYTSKNIPRELVLFEEHHSKTEALKGEKCYKTGVGREWIDAQINN
jgi:putative endonuclease